VVWLAHRQVSYWGCFGLFNGPVGDTGWRKQFERCENGASNNALREIYFTVSPCLLFIVLLSIFIPSCFLFLSFFFFPGIEQKVEVTVQRKVEKAAKLSTRKDSIHRAAQQLPFCWTLL